MSFPFLCLLLSVLLWLQLVFVSVESLENGLARKPLLGWSTWNTFKLNVNESLIRSSALYMSQSPLKEAGYEWILLDDGWTSCQSFNESDSRCLVAGERDSEDRLVADPMKFPSGMNALTEYVHSLGLKIGIYTAVSQTTCGGYMGSLGYEAIDAQTFADWGFDFIKHDTCNTDCNITCIQHSTLLMSQAIQHTGKPIIYYIDSGNPTSGPRVWNKRLTGVHQPEEIKKVARRKEDLVYFWGPSRAHMFKSWFDRDDSWLSVLTNAHNQVRLEPFHQCGAFHTPDMLTVGQGAMSASEYRVEVFLWTILAAPLILGCDIRQMDTFSLELVTHPEILAVNQDEDCSQGSLVRAVDASEVWVRALSDGTFAATLINKHDTDEQTVTLHISPHIQYGDFYPAFFPQGVYIRDIYNKVDLGFFQDNFSILLPPHDAIILKVTPASF